MINKGRAYGDTRTLKHQWPPRIRRTHICRWLIAHGPRAVRTDLVEVADYSANGEEVLRYFRGR